jgi:hypothetical protein
MIARETREKRRKKLKEEIRRRSPDAKNTFAFRRLTERRTVNGER